MALSDFDRDLLKRCIAGNPNAWEDFVDRFLGLVLHVIRHTARSRELELRKEDLDDLTAEVFYHIVRDDFSILRKFRERSSLATYLTVIARRIVIRDLLRNRAPEARHHESLPEQISENGESQQRVSDRDEIQRMIAGLSESEADVVRLYHLEGLTYREIADALRIPENSIGPTLTRARAKMRGFSVN